MKQSALAQDLEPNRILIIRFARLGDVILLVPAIKLLRRRFPNANLSALVDHRYAPILEICSSVDEVIAVNRIALRDERKLVAARKIFSLANRIRGGRYDIVIDFQSFRETNLLAWYSQATLRLGLKRNHSPYLRFCFNMEPVLEDKSQHVSSVFVSLLKPLGIGPYWDDPLLDLSSEDLAKAEEFLICHDASSNSLLLGFNVGAGSRGRMWPKQKFASLAKKLIWECDATVIVFSGPQDGASSKQVAELINDPRCIVANQLSLRSLAAVMSRCKLLVTNDTGPMHLGPAVGVPTLGLFSLGYPENYRPLGDSSRFVKREPIDTLPVEEVYENVIEMIDAVQRSALPRKVSPS